MSADDRHARERSGNRPKLEAAAHQNESIVGEFLRSVKTIAVWLRKTETGRLRDEGWNGPLPPLNPDRFRETGYRNEWFAI
jgi:hypothetical protein